MKMPRVNYLWLGLIVLPAVLLTYPVFAVESLDKFAITKVPVKQFKPTIGINKNEEIISARFTSAIVEITNSARYQEVYLPWFVEMKPL